MLCSGSSLPYFARTELRRTSLVVDFFNYREKNIFKKSNIESSIEKPSATFWNGKYIVLNDICHAQYLVHYTLEYKSNKICKNESDGLDHNLIESNYEVFFYLKKAWTDDKKVLILFDSFRD